jgi:hypothetical protein
MELILIILLHYNFYLMNYYMSYTDADLRRKLNRELIGMINYITNSLSEKTKDEQVAKLISTLSDHSKRATELKSTNPEKAKIFDAAIEFYDRKAKLFEEKLKLINAKDKSVEAFDLKLEAYSFIDGEPATAATTAPTTPQAPTAAAKPGAQAGGKKKSKKSSKKKSSKKKSSKKSSKKKNSKK